MMFVFQYRQTIRLRTENLIASEIQNYEDKFYHDK